MLKLISKGPCKIYESYGVGANGVWGKDFSTHINNRADTFLENIYMGQIPFSFIFMNYFFHQILFVLITKTNIWQAAKIN